MTFALYEVLKGFPAGVWVVDCLFSLGIRYPWQQLPPLNNDDAFPELRRDGDG